MPLGTEVGLSPKRGTAAPNFRPMSTVAKQFPISAAAELLSGLLNCFDLYSRFVKGGNPFQLPNNQQSQNTE